MKTLIEIGGKALGDAIGAVAVIEKYRIESGKNISVLCNFPNLFKKTYPELDFIESINTPFDERILINYKFNMTLLDGFAKDLNINSCGVIPKVDVNIKERPIKGKYVCIAVQSTAQCKYWNYPGGWDELCRMLRKKGLTPVCIDKYESFGIDGNFNVAPSKSVKKIGMSLDDTINYLYHCEFFIGLSSGLSWLAQAVGKPIVMISNATSKDHEYIDDKTIRVYDESVCNSCFNQPDKYTFNPGDWLWCPVYRSDELRRFICTKAITPDFVMKKIEENFNI
jgi:autotransporter strand-loop-strand O-heptosyltransferase